jgi:subtilisin-like proprotein convertase family protein
MQPKFTLKKTNFRFRIVSVIVAAFFLMTGNLYAQQYINGNLSTGATHVGSGTPAPAGTTWSEMQGANTTLGFGSNFAANLSLADNFVVPAGPSWSLSKITFFAYSTGFAGATSPFDNIRVRIFNTDPSVGNPAPIWGDFTTNRLVASPLANIFRTAGGAGVPGQTRRVWAIEANVNAVLTPGTYWVEWTVGSGALGNFTPPSTVTGQPTPPGGNSKQHDFALNTWTNLIDAGGGGAQDQYFIVDYANAVCSGTPAPGNTNTTSAAVCPATNFTLSLANATSGTGVTYQWQSGPSATGPWTNIGGATNSTYTSTLSATTYFRCAVTCSAGPATGNSNPVLVSLNPPSACYCIPPASNCTFDDEILNVTLGTLNNSSSGCSGAGYTYYSAVSAPTIFAGAANPVSVTIGPGGGDDIGVFIDYNQNGQFEVSEYTQVGITAGGTVSNNIAVPAGALTGVTRMRVRVRWNALITGSGSCTAFTFGETEDYNVNIQPCVQGVFNTPPANATIMCSGNASFTVATTGSLLSHAWQFRTSAAAPWQNVVNGGIYSGATTQTLTLTNVPQTMNGYQYRALIQGGCTAIDFSSPPATLTVNPLIATVTPTSATICRGAIQQLTLTNASSPTTVTFTNNTALLVPDNTPNGVFSTIAVSGIPAGAIISDVSVRINMAHTWVGDLEINLIAPNNGNMNLIGELDGGTGSNGSDDFVNTVISSSSTNPISGAPAPRTGTFAAERRVGYGPQGNAQTVTNIPWTALTGTMNGNWRLGLSDWFNGDEGTLANWSISITYGAPAAGVWTASPASPNSMFTDAAATIAYTGTPATSIYVKPDVSTNYTVIYNTATPCASTPTVIPVNVSQPVTTVSAPSNAAVCHGGTTTFTAAAAAGSPLTYQWQVSTDNGLTWANVSNGALYNGVTTGTLTITGATNAAPNMNGYRYRLNASAAPCAGVVSGGSGTLTVHALPAVTLTASDLQLTPGQTSTLTATSSPAAASYVWRLNGTVISGITGNTYTADIDKLGTYTVTAVSTSTPACTSTAALAGSVTIGSEASNKLWIYPNPNNGVFQVRLYYPTNNSSSISERRAVYIYNAIGEIVATNEFALTNNTPQYLRMDFDLSRLATGTYAVKVVDKVTGKITSGLFVKQ